MLGAIRGGEGEREGDPTSQQPLLSLAWVRGRGDLRTLSKKGRDGKNEEIGFCVKREGGGKRPLSRAGEKRGNENISPFSSSLTPKNPRTDSLFDHPVFGQRRHLLLLLLRDQVSNFLHRGEEREKERKILRFF